MDTSEKWIGDLLFDLGKSGIQPLSGDQEVHRRVLVADIRNNTGGAREMVGQCAMNMSLTMYFLYFLPQLAYNQMYRRTEKISLLSQTVMVLVNCFDLTYSVGMSLPWQYVAVSWTSILCLVIQELQILVFDGKSRGIGTDDGRVSVGDGKTSWTPSPANVAATRGGGRPGHGGRNGVAAEGCARRTALC